MDALHARSPLLLDRIVDKFRREIPFYTTDSLSPDDLRATLSANLDALLRRLGGAGEIDAEEARVTGRARAVQGAPLVDLLAAYGLAFREAWLEVVAAATDVPQCPS